MSANKEANMPFDRSYVLRTTARHIIKAVDNSIEKTTARIPEFSGNSAKSHEILQTLSDLQSLRKSINPNPVA
jgi:hypothetical protein